MSKESVDVYALAKLARIAITEEEAQTLAREIPEILAFVAQVQEVAGDEVPEPVPGAHHNIMRDDHCVHEKGAHTKDLLEAAPDTEGQHVRVQQVITGGKHAK